jgi:hypothetical protein
MDNTGFGTFSTSPYAPLHITGIPQHRQNQKQRHISRSSATLTVLQNTIPCSAIHFTSNGSTRDVLSE